MSRIRTVKPEFFKHEELFLAEAKFKLPLRIAFVGLWCVADREGRFKWKPNVLKLDVLPFDNCDFSRVLDALAACGFIHKYEINSEYFGLIPKFPIHQVINNRESASVLPEPTEFLRVGDASGTPLLLAQVEGKGKEGKGRGKEVAPETLFKDSPFVDFDKFINEFVNTDYFVYDIKHYYNCVLNWSNAKSAKRKDWIATARNFMLSDKKDGKPVLAPITQSNRKRLSHGS